MTMIRVVAAFLDTKQLKLYKEDGTTVEIPQGDPRITAILEKHTDALTRNEIVEIDLERVNEYAGFEEKTNGLVKFFRVAKRFVKHIFNADDYENKILGTIPDKPEEPLELTDVVETPLVSNPVATSAPTAADVTDATVNQKPEIKDAISEIMANAQSVNDPSFKESETTEEETIIAVVNDKIIPAMENLKGQFAHANKLGSTVGVQNFLNRITTIIDKRGHSVDDLLKFMEKGDLPIADDGSIIAYKRLNSTHKGHYVDVHSGQVIQRVGSYVCMDEKLVDPNRHKDCSNGLHIARRGYLGSFSGNIMVLCKIAPEDVIAVPAYNANKVRVMAYHIVGLIPENEARTLNNNKPIEGSEAKRLLTAAISGAHIGKIEQVRITQQRGGGLQITQLVKGHEKPEVIAKNLPESVALDDPDHISVVDPTKTAAKVAENKAAITPVEPEKKAPAPVKEAEPVMSRADNIKAVAEKTKKDPKPAPEPVKVAHVSIQRQLFNDKKYAELVAYKRQKKAGWTKLGFNEAEVKIIERSNITTDITANAEPVKEEPKVEAKAEIKVSPEAKEVAEEMTKTSGVMTVLNDIIARARSGDRAAYVELIERKKKAKKSWTALGVENFEAIQAKFESKK